MASSSTGKRLSDTDIKELQKWVALSGAECVARVSAALAERGPGNVSKPYGRLLVEMARRQKRSPMRTTSSVAAEVAQEAKQAGTGHYPDKVSLQKLLERQFRKYRPAWRIQAADGSDRWPPISAPHLPETAAERRAFGRIVELLPTAIDLFDMVFLEAQRTQPQSADLLTKMGRERVSMLLGNALEREMRGKPSGRNRGIPRSFLDLIDPELREFAQSQADRTMKRREPKPKD